MVLALRARLRRFKIGGANLVVLAHLKRRRFCEGIESLWWLALSKRCTGYMRLGGHEN